ncbi:MAG: DUF4232 domain-containing protein [Actinobacteria bacterium]|nr:DUF4232 domain-containing protein [Actinomycetota bacterium]
MAGALLFRNTSSKTCTLQGHPHVTLIDAKGAILPVEETHAPPGFSREQPRPPTWPVFVLHPNDQVTSFIVSSNWCGPHVAGWRVSLPGGGDVTLTHGWSMGLCVIEAQGPSLLSVGGFKPPPGPDKWPLVPMILDAPRLSATGASLDYVVTLMNVPKHEFQFPSNCPSYVEQLIKHHQVIESERFVLNCGALPGPIPGGTAARFAMQMRVPAGVTGPATLAWVLDPPYGFWRRVPVTL